MNLIFFAFISVVVLLGIFGGHHGDHFKGVFMTAMALGGLSLWAFTPLPKDLWRLFRPLFTICDDGIELSAGGFLPWGSIQEVVVFYHEGTKHFGIRLKADVRSLAGKNLDEVFEDDLNWRVHKMPLAAFYNSVNPPIGQVLTTFHDEFGLPIKDHISSRIVSTASRRNTSSSDIRLRLWSWLRVSIICVVTLCFLGALLRIVERQLGSLILLLSIVGTVIPSLLAITYSAVIMRGLLRGQTSRPWGRAMFTWSVHVVFICGVTLWLVELTQLILGFTKK